MYPRPVLGAWTAVLLLSGCVNLTEPRVLSCGEACLDGGHPGGDAVVEKPSSALDGGPSGDARSADGPSSPPADGPGTPPADGAPSPDAPPADGAPSPDAPPASDGAPSPDASAPTDSDPPPNGGADATPPLDTGDTPCVTSLAGAWHLDDGSGTTALDGSCHGNHGTLVNGQAADWQAGRLGGALAIDPNSGNYVRVPNSASLDPAGPFTVATWIFPVGWNAGRRRIVQKGAADDQYRLWSESNALWFGASGLSVTGVFANLPGTGAWHHVAGVYDGATLQLFVDGAQVGSTAVTGTPHLTTDDLLIGTRSTASTSSDFFNGRLDEVLLYGRALSATEIAGLAAGGAAPL